MFCERVKELPESDVSGRKLTKGMVQEKNLEKHIEKQMGCMAGFLQIFDRHQILNGKHLYSPKSLPPPSVRFLILLSLPFSVWFSVISRTLEIF